MDKSTRTDYIYGFISTYYPLYILIKNVYGFFSGCGVSASANSVVML